MVARFWWRHIVLCVIMFFIVTSRHLGSGSRYQFLYLSSLGRYFVPWFLFHLWNIKEYVDCLTGLIYWCVHREYLLVLEVGGREVGGVGLCDPQEVCRGRKGGCKWWSVAVLRTTLRTGSKKRFLNDPRERKRKIDIETETKTQRLPFGNTNQFSHHLRQLKVIKIRIVYVFGIQCN